jgi:hypothetical protein
MSHYDEMKALVESLGDDVDKFYNKGNKTAGTRARKTLQDIKTLAQTMRTEIQDSKKTA